MENDIYTIYLISFLTFVAVIILIEGSYLLFRGIREEGVVKMNRRLKLLSAGGAHGKEVLNLLRRNELSSNEVVNRVLTKIPRIKLIDRTLEQAGLTISVSRYLLTQLLLIVVSVSILFYGLNFHPAISFLIGAMAGFFLPVFYVSIKRKDRLDKFTEQLPDTLDYIARSLRAGNPFSASLKGVANEMQDPTGSEFGITFDEMNYGLELEDALKNLGRRSGSEEMNMFITAVLIQKTTGGNLADVLNRIATVMRARAGVIRDVAVLSAEMRASSYILIALPFFVAGAISIFNPGYLDVLFDNPVGQIVILVQLVLMLIGYLIMRRMINFHV
ncbi:MAG: type II secretion system F family protein [Gammaproteobacteria bacterium]|nr:type II secretion system F family protein [Gammaproteobacteria bacterium]MCW8923646.1 type II secretion system F family protein [Gammaproteobacteria bacterium]